MNGRFSATMTMAIRLTTTLLLLGACGCTPPPEFRVNQVEIRKREMQVLGPDGGSFAESQLTDIGSFLTALFGTPDAPSIPSALHDGELGPPLIRPESLAVAAGPVSSDLAGKARGLYREHCVHCHGITGDGAGPTAAFLNPYPRDFRLGKFKYKSTPLGVPPTHQDLKEVLVEGVPGTAMPSFRRLPDDEIEALIEYVRYLTIRGQVERELLAILSEDPDPALDLIATEAKIAEVTAAAEAAAEAGEEEPVPPIFSARAAFDEVVMPLVERWWEAEESLPVISERPEGLSDGHPDRPAMLARGRELFFGAGACAQCHGQTGLGDGQADDYDDWTKDWMKELGIQPTDQVAIDRFVALGAMPPRKLIPRNLRLGVFRGGRQPRDLYVRIKHGIEGTPMPAAAANLTDEDLWCLAEYVRQLPYEPLSRPERAALNERPPR